jgi:hypothetical protein
MKKTLDADKEEWDIIDDGTDPTAITTYRRTSMNNVAANSQRGTIAIKPSSERVRKMPPSTSLSSPSPSITSCIMESPSLLAAIPGSGRITMVRLVGRSLFKQPTPSTTNIITTQIIAKTMNGTVRKRGRPMGSKNVPKTPPNNETNVICSPTGKKRRLNTPIIHVPASARKAAAMRATSTIDKPPALRPVIVNELNRNQTKNRNPATRKPPALQTDKAVTTRTLPPRRASLSSSTYTIESPPSSDGSTYHSDNNTVEDSDTITVASSVEDDTSDLEPTQRPSKRRIMSTTQSSRRSSRLRSPSTQDKQVGGALSSESATPKRRTTRSSATKLTNVSEKEQFSGTVKDVAMSTRHVKQSTTPSTPPTRLPKLAFIANNDTSKEMTLAIRSVDLTPSVYNESRDQPMTHATATNNTNRPTSKTGRKLVQQNLKSMIVPKEKSRRHSLPSVASCQITKSKARNTSTSHSTPQKGNETNFDPRVDSSHSNGSTTKQQYESYSNHRPRRKSASYTLV